MTENEESRPPRGFEVPPSFLSSEPDGLGHQTNFPGQAKAIMLPFDQITPRDFERLCYRLIIREATIRCTSLYGVEGSKQHGIDIVAVKKMQPVERPSYYQCKNTKVFFGGDLRTAVEKFLKGPFAEEAADLTIIVRCPSKTSLQDESNKQREKLAMRGIIFTLWTIEELAVRLDSAPEIVEKFFGPHWAGHFCVSTPSHLVSSTLAALIEASKTDPVLSASQLRDPEFTPRRSQRISGELHNLFVLRNEEVIVETFLPNTRNPISSALLTFRQYSASAIQISLSHVFMINVLFRDRNSGASERRGFYRYRKDKPSASVVVDLEGVRLNISEAAYRHLCEAADALFFVFRDALIQLDRDWEVGGCQLFIRDSEAPLVCLGSIPFWAWERIRELIGSKNDEHESQKFPGLRVTANSLQIRETSSEADMRGRHHLSVWRGPILDHSIWDGSSHFSVKLFWCPPDEASHVSTVARGRRGYWGCDTTVKWLQTELLPACVAAPQISTRPLLSRIFRRVGVAATAANVEDISAVFQVAQQRLLLPTPSMITHDFLLKLVHTLEEFSTSTPRATKATAQSLNLLYSAIRFSLKYVELSHTGYLISKLGLSKSPITDQSQVIAEILKMAEAVVEKTFVAWALITGGLQALREVISRSEGLLNEAERRKLVELVEPLMMEHDEQLRLTCHCPRAV